MPVVVRLIRAFADANGRVPFEECYERLVDERARQRIDARLVRLMLGNPGDYASVGEGVFELRIHYGPGIRIYVGALHDSVVILLGGGDKGGQDEDIERAKGYWREFKGSRSAEVYRLPAVYPKKTR